MTLVRRAVVTLAALVVGTVLLGPVGEVLFYGLEGFPVEADVKGFVRILSATGAVAVLLVGAAVGARVTGPARGWPLVAAGLLVTGLLTAFAPLDPDSAFGELQPLIRPVAALAAGVAIGAALVAVLPAAPREGDPWPVAALAAGIVVGVPIGPMLLPAFPDPRYDLGWADVAAVLLAMLAALLAPRPAPEPGTPAVGRFGLVALAGAVLSAAFHMEYVGRAADNSPAIVVVLVLLLTIALWVAMAGALIRWSAGVAGAEAARFALTMAGAAGVLFTASGRNLGLVWGFPWVPLLGVATAVAGVLLTRLRPTVPWDAVGVGAAALVALLTVVLARAESGYAATGVAVVAFALGAALARTSAAGALCGLLVLVSTLPVLVGTITPLGRQLGEGDGFGQRVVLYAPFWLVGLLTAALLARRPRRAGDPAPTPLAVG
ncbi:hypothetical protein [Asanoa siamensis]|uniref:MFS transporter n=1 Tax=Asanoa siamensis TaxID=926357 RepID=A0ABQ4D3F0_9ACTN|nr:hypothetical protein [Asanoa siamensis]GIF78060.1 hypothetical protein Asi02nite_75780 [Asanoa siamensis]